MENATFAKNITLVITGHKDLLAGRLSLLKRGMAVIRDMIGYLRHPYPVAARTPFTPQALLELLKLLGFALLMLPVLGLLMGAIFAATGVSMPEPSDEYKEVMNRPNFILLAAVMAPLVEELLFRSWLGKRGGVLWVAPLLLAGLAVIVLVNSDTMALGIRAALMLIVLGSFALYIRRYLSLRRDDTALDHALTRVFPFAFWGTSIGFGLMHLANYEGGDMGVLLPLIILPQFMVGVILGYIRMRFGLLPAMGFHGAYNTTLLTVFTMLSQAAP